MFVSSTCNEFDECEAVFEVVAAASSGVVVVAVAVDEAAAIVLVEAAVVAYYIDIQVLDIVHRYIAEVRVILQEKSN